MKNSLIITILLGLAMPAFMAGAEALDLAGAVQEKAPRHDLIIQLLSLGSNPNITVNGCPLVIYVTMKLVRKKTADDAKWYEILKTLIKHKVSIDERDTNDATALMYAAYYGHYDAVALLVKNHARIDICNKDGKSPIAHANDGHKSALTQSQKDQYTQIIALLTSYANRKK